MAAVVRGPAWSETGLTVASGRYPLRVERHMGRLVDGLLPGVITTTGHARTFALHALVWAEAAERGLDQAEALELLRRCEVVLAGITLQHEGAHFTQIPQPHGGDKLRANFNASGQLDVAKLASSEKPSERYSPNASGFASAYLGSELRLGLAENGQPPKPGPRTDVRLLRDALGGILELAGEDTLEVEILAAVPQLCACAAPISLDGPWLQRLFVAPDQLEALEQADRARRQTAQLLGRVLMLPGSSTEAPQDRFRQALGFGQFIAADPVAAQLRIAHAWRGAILRNYSVGAWRRIWSWLVDLLGEPAPVHELADQLADVLDDITVAQLIDGLPDRTNAGGVLLPAEEQLRMAQWEPDPLTEIRLLTLGALRLDDLEGRVLAAFAGREDEDDLGPYWFRAQLDARRDDHLRDFARWLVEMMVARAQRVALSKMEYDRARGRFWIPSRIRERAGLISRLSREGWGEVGLRVDTFSSVLSGCGVIARTEDGQWALTDEGGALLA
jgi:hypothetical protein